MKKNELLYNIHVNIMINYDHFHPKKVKNYIKMKNDEI